MTEPTAASAPGHPGAGRGHRTGAGLPRPPRHVPYSNGGYAALGQLISDIAERQYPEAAAALVLRPLGMTSSSFPERWPGGARAAGGP